MQLEDWTRLGNLTALTLRRCSEGHSGSLLAVVPNADDGIAVAGAAAGRPLSAVPDGCRWAGFDSIREYLTRISGKPSV